VQKENVLHRLKFLYDQVHQTAERVQHLPASMPLHVHPQSLNWDEDLHRFEDEYNWLVGQALADKTLTPDELAAQELPERFHRGWQCV